MYPTTAAGIWAQLMGERSNVLSKAERYAALTIPSLLMPDGTTSDKEENTHDMQSVGAQAVNHLTNKVMLAMFAPSRPAMRLELGKKTKADAANAQIDPTNSLSTIEREASQQLDKRALRPALYRTIRLLIVTGNALQLRENESMRVFSIRSYCVKRTVDGRVHTLIVKEDVCADELDTELREAAGIPQEREHKVAYYRLVQLQPDGRYTETQWIDQKDLGEKFKSVYTADNSPWDALCWSRSDDANYGVGQVEEYAGDFEALSALCESIIDGAIVGTEVRWLVSPAGITQVDDLKNSRNGDALNGRPEDVNAINAQIDKALDIALKVSQHWEQRVARGFLLLSALTRNAERVTAEEIRMTAMELETALGGVYSFLAHALQLPLFRWLCKLAGHDLAGTDIDLVIVTGLAALSRTGDIENLAQAFEVLGKLAAMPEPLLMRLKFDKLATDVGAGFNVDMSPYLMSDKEFAQAQANAATARAAEATVTAAGESAAQQGNVPQ
jgi:hypothetical protein